MSNLHIADDVLTMANSLKQLKKMIADFERRTTARGLETTHKDQNHNEPDNKQVTRNRSRNRRDACRGTFS